MRTRHVIVDNETLDVAPSAVLLTIGAVAVEISDGKAIILGSWYRRLNFAPGAQAGRTVSDGTLAWWMSGNTSAGACIHALSDIGKRHNPRLPLWLAMYSLSRWLELNRYPIWGNGSDFDNAQLQHAFDQLGLRWPYHRNRCLRSLKGLVLDMYPGTQLPTFPANKIKHHALHDAEHEADVLATLINVLGAHKEAA